MEKRIRILYTIPNFKTAGSQYVLLSLYKRIDRSVFDPFICVEKFPEMIPDDIPLDRQLVFQWTGNKLNDVRNFRRLLKQHKIDVLHSWDYKSNYLEALATRMAGVKNLYTKKNNAWSKRWKLKSFLASHIAYDNPELKDRFFASWLFRNKIFFIPHGVDTEIFRPLEAIINEGFNIVCIGNIGTNKNQLFLLKVLEQLPQDVVLHLYGKEDKDYRKQLDDYITDNQLGSRVFFHGFVENKDIPQVLRNMDLFVLPSINEGLPVSILEALACGVPVLSSDSGGGARYLLDAEHVFSLSNPKELVDRISRFYDMEASQMENLAIEVVKLVLERHTIEMEVLAYENLYKKMMLK